MSQGSGRGRQSRIDDLMRDSLRPVVYSGAAATVVNMSAHLLARMVPE
jgi:hypothetical protein